MNPAYAQWPEKAYNSDGFDLWYRLFSAIPTASSNRWNDQSNGFSHRAAHIGEWIRPCVAIDRRGRICPHCFPAAVLFVHCSTVVRHGQHALFGIDWIENIYQQSALNHKLAWCSLTDNPNRYIRPDCLADCGGKLCIKARQPRITSNTDDHFLLGEWFLNPIAPCENMSGNVTNIHVCFPHFWLQCKTNDELEKNVSSTMDFVVVLWLYGNDTQFSRCCCFICICKCPNWFGSLQPRLR